jgi:hypothetical protein
VNARLPIRSIIVAAVGAIGVVIGYVLDPARTAAAYLVAYGACLAVALGALAMIMIARVTAATWFVAIRRQAEQVAATLPVFAILLIPVLLSYRLLYPWAGDVEVLAPDARASVLAKSAYLNLPFFVGRAVVYVVAWIVTAEMLRRASLSQDAGDSRRLDRRMYAVSAAGLIVFAVTLSFAAFDWFMSLTPAWYSTIYGVNYFAGGMVGSLALISLLVARGRVRGELPQGVGADHLHALAKLLLTFVLFWVYIGFSQLIVIWSAEIPIERGWYAVRMRGGWEILGGILVAGHFALPFCVLLVQAIKRSTVAMASLGGWLLVMHYLDVYWIVMPDAPFHGGWGYIADAAALLFIGGAACAVWAVRRRGEAMMPVGDARLVASLQYSTD